MLLPTLALERAAASLDVPRVEAVRFDVVRDSGGSFHSPAECRFVHDPGPVTSVSVLDVYAEPRSCSCLDAALSALPRFQRLFDELETLDWALESLLSAPGSLDDSALVSFVEHGSTLRRVERLLVGTLAGEGEVRGEVILVSVLGDVLSEVRAALSSYEALVSSAAARSRLVLLSSLALVGEAPVSGGFLAPGLTEAFPGVGPAGSEEARRARARSFEAWVSARELGLPGSEVLSRVRAAALDGLTVDRFEQLPPVPHRLLLEGEDFHAWLREVWEVFFDSSLSALLGEWDASLQVVAALPSGEHVVLLDVGRLDSNVLGPVAAEVFPGVSRSFDDRRRTQGVALTRLPSRVFEALCAQPLHRSGPEALPPWVLHAEPALPGDTLAVLETALSLWDRPGSGVDSVFGDVLAASRAALSPSLV